MKKSVILLETLDGVRKVYPHEHDLNNKRLYAIKVEYYDSPFFTFDRTTRYVEVLYEYLVTNWFGNKEEVQHIYREVKR